MKPGIYSNISNNSYHSGDGISKTQLDKVAKSPAHYAYHKEHSSESTPAMNFGSATHALILEPDTFDDEVIIQPEINRRTNAGKAEYAEFLESSKGKVVIKRDEFDEIQRIRDAVFAHPAAAQLLTGGIAEQSAYWTDEETGLLCRCRPDYVKGQAIVDLKTTADASPFEFGRSAAKFRYHVQAAYYMDGFNAAGGNVSAFGFVAVEKTAPYNVAVYVAEDAHIEKGRELYRRDLERLAEAMQANEFGGYGDEPMSLMLPEWSMQ